MKIKCTNCGYIEETDKDFFVKLIGGAMPAGGFWAWTTYLFAGTGFAMAIVVAIIGGGVAMLIFKDEIVEWIINKDYKCAKCGHVKWKACDTDKEKLKTSKTEAEHTSSPAVGLPASFNYLKGMSVQALVGSEELTKFRTEWVDATSERKAEIVQEIGAKHMREIIEAFKEEEETK